MTDHLRDPQAVSWGDLAEAGFESDPPHLSHGLSCGNVPREVLDVNSGSAGRRRGRPITAPHELLARRARPVRGRRAARAAKASSSRATRSSRPEAVNLGALGT